MDYSSLPLNVLEKVESLVFNYEFCSLQQLTNLCLVSKQTYQEIKPLMYTKNNRPCFTLECKCTRTLKQNDVVYLCKPFNNDKGYTYDWRCIQCTLSSKLNKHRKGLGKGGMKIHCYGVIDVYDPMYRRCSAVVKKNEYNFKFCKSINCTHGR